MLWECRRFDPARRPPPIGGDSCRRVGLDFFGGARKPTAAFDAKWGQFLITPAAFTSMADRGIGGAE
jgi:hypothetical protein